MRKFYYTAVNTSGKELSGTIDADNRDEAIEIIKKKDLFPTYVNGLDEGPMRPIPPPPRVVKYDDSSDKFFISIILALILVFAIWLGFSLINKCQEWKIKSVIKQMVQEECLKPEYWSKK